NGTDAGAFRVPYRESVRFAGGDGAWRELTTTHGYSSLASAEHYLSRTIDTITTEQVDGGAPVTVARTQWEYEDALRRLVREHTYAGESKKLTRRTHHDPATGVLLWEIAPEQYRLAGDAAPRTSYAYDAHGVTVTQTTNPLGHVVKTWTDIATGITWAEVGPLHATTPLGVVYASRRKKLDGLGRVLEECVPRESLKNGYSCVTVAGP